MLFHILGRPAPSGVRHVKLHPAHAGHARILERAQEPFPKERLELRPQGVEGGITDAKPREEVMKPLTREELLSALSAKRTMASDIEAVRQKNDSTKE